MCVTVFATNAESRRNNNDKTEVSDNCQKREVSTIDSTLVELNVNGSNRLRERPSRRTTAPDHIFLAWQHFNYAGSLKTAVSQAKLVILCNLNVRKRRKHLNKLIHWATTRFLLCLQLFLAHSTYFEFKTCFRIIFAVFLK